MEALLILTAVVMIAVAWVWLIVSSLRLPIHRTVIAVALPLATLLLRDRGYPRAPRFLLVTGLLCGLAGIGMLYHQQPERFGALVSGEWVAAAQTQTTLNGAIMGQPFNPDRVLWRGDELLFEEGPPDRIRRSIGIRFDVASQMMTEPTIERIPGDEEGWPELMLQWHGGALEPPGLRRVTTDYSLSLGFSPEQGEQAKVVVHMHLLPVHGTWMRGEMLLAGNPQWLIDLLTKQTTKPDHTKLLSLPRALRPWPNQSARLTGIRSACLPCWMSPSPISRAGYGSSLFPEEPTRVSSRASRRSSASSCRCRAAPIRSSCSSLRPIWNGSSRSPCAEHILKY